MPLKSKSRKNKSRTEEASQNKDVSRDTALIQIGLIHQAFSGSRQSSSEFSDPHRCLAEVERDMVKLKNMSEKAQWEVLERSGMATRLEIWTPEERHQELENAIKETEEVVKLARKLLTEKRTGSPSPVGWRRTFPRFMHHGRHRSRSRHE